MERNEAMTQITSAAARRFATSLEGDLLTPESADYDDVRQLWNGMIDKRPAYIARCLNVGDVMASVNFGRTNNLEIAVHGGGHNVAGLATVDGGLMIDLSLMKGIDLDPEARTVWAEGGVTIGELDAATQEHGLAVPLGVVTATGIAGLTLGGGFGWMRNKYGLSCDNLLAAEVVTADGNVVMTSEGENADLLWGLRGGGGNFGIVTRFKFNAYPIGPQIYFTFVLHDGDHMAEALKFYRQYCAEAPDEVSTLAAAGIFPPGAEMYPEELHGRNFIAFVGMYTGTVEEGRRVLDPLSSFREPLLDLSGEMAYLEAQQAYDEDYPDGIRYYWKSLNLLELSDEAIERFVEHARRQPSPHSTTDLWHIGGAVQRFGADHGAFYGRHASFLINPEANWHHPEDDEANIGWAREFIEAMREFSDGSRYMNFAGFLEEGDEMMRDAFGENYRRLAALKAKYDPHNLFRLNQNIKPTAD